MNNCIYRIRKNILFFIISLILIFLLWLNSTTFFRLNLAKYFITRNQLWKASLLYKEALRKELLRFLASDKTVNEKDFYLLKDIHKWLAQFYFSNNDCLSLIEENKLWLKAFPDDKIIHTKLCLIYLKKLNLIGASQLFFDYKRKFKDNIFDNLKMIDEWYKTLNLPYAKNNLWQEAITDWDRYILSILPQSQRHFQVALVYENLDMMDMAIRNYKETIELVPSHIDALIFS